MNILSIFCKKNDPTISIPRVILDEDMSYTPFTGELTSENVDMAVSVAIHEIAQPGYRNTLVSNDRLDIIQCAMSDVSDEDEDVTFKVVSLFIQREQGIEISEQEYLAASKLYFS